jgi:glycosyltransferase involved in cell wall biosynthesis
MTRSLDILTLSHLYPSAAYPGSGPFVRDEVLELAKRHRIQVIAPLRVPVRRPGLASRVLAVPRRSIEDGIPVIRPRILEPPVGGPQTAAWLWALRLERPLHRAYREGPADLVHAHFAIPDGFAAARFASRERVPLVLTVWGSDVLVLAQQAKARPLLVRTLAQANAIIAVSDELANRVERLGAPHERVRVIPGGVPYESPLDRDSARQLLGIPVDDTCVLWVGGFLPVKQPAHVIDAVRSLDARAGERRLRLVMIGDGPLRRAVADLVRQADVDETVQLVGHLTRQEVWAWQCAADVLVNSSSSEGTPLSVLEALGAGTPIVAYPLPGVRAVVEAVDGGTIATGNAPEDLAEAIHGELATERDRARLAAAARQRFDIVRAAQAIEDVYATLV